MRFKFALAVCTLICLFGAPTTARADAITIGSASQVAGMKISGSGTFSVDMGRTLKKIEMLVGDQTGNVVSRTPGTVPQGTTQWGSISNALNPGTYSVYAEITTSKTGTPRRKDNVHELHAGHNTVRKTERTGRRGGHPCPPAAACSHAQGGELCRAARSR